MSKKIKGLPYFGSKNRVAHKIIKQIESVNYKKYCEPFFGGGSILLNKDKTTDKEIVNDLNRDVVNFFEVIKNKKQKFLDKTQYIICHRDIFEKFKNEDIERFDDVERAFRFFYLIKHSFGSLTETFSSRGYTRRRIIRDIDNIYNRIRRVGFENIDFKDFIKKFDSENTLFYIDPPYYLQCAYKYNLKEKDFIELSNILRNIKGKFFLSINEHNKVYEWFKYFSFMKIECCYSIYRKSGRQRKYELLINNVGKIGVI